MKTIEEIKTEIDDLEKSISPLYEERDRLNDIIGETRTKINDLTEEYDRIRIESLGESIDWNFLLNSNGAESMTLYRESKKRIEDLGPFTSSGIWSDSNQRAVKLMIYRDKPGEVERAIAGIELLLPHIKPFRMSRYQDVDLKYFGIFEQSLSHRFIYSLGIDEVKQQFFIFANNRVQKETKNLKDMVQYIHDVLYYDTFEETP